MISSMEWALVMDRLEKLEAKLNQRLREIAEIEVVTAKLIVQIREEMGSTIPNSVKDSLDALGLMLDSMGEVPPSATPEQLKNFKPDPNDNCRRPSAEG